MVYLRYIQIILLKEKYLEMDRKAKYDLSANVAESFVFKLKDEENRELSYQMRYPSAKDFEPSKEIDAKIAKLQKDIDSPDLTDEYKEELRKQVEDLEKEKAGVFYKLITPIGHERDIQDVIESVNILVVKNFNNMIEREMK